MHDYSIDTPIRRYVHVAIAIASLSLPAAITWLTTVFSSAPKTGFTLSFGVTFAIFYFVFDQYIWKWLGFAHHLPNLNGEWLAEGKSSYKDPNSGENAKFSMKVKIRQTFSQIEFFTETADSTSRSFMASIETRHAVSILRYGFDNTPKNMSSAELQRHPGMMELRISDDDTLEGDYFSGKHRLRYGELVLKRS